VSCDLCKFRTVPCKFPVQLTAGAGSFEIDPKALGVTEPAIDFQGKIFGSGHSVRSIHVADSTGNMRMFTNAGTWAQWFNVEQFPQYLDIHFFMFTKFQVELIGFGMVPSTKTVTVVVEIDPLVAGCACACGRTK